MVHQFSKKKKKKQFPILCEKQKGKQKQASKIRATWGKKKKKNKKGVYY